jgi:hypothetical protein
VAAMPPRARPQRYFSRCVIGRSSGMGGTWLHRVLAPAGKGQKYYLFIFRDGRLGSSDRMPCWATSLLAEFVSILGLTA